MFNVKVDIFVIHKLIITIMIWFYVQNSFSLNVVCLETVQINNQTVLHFVTFMVKIIL